MSRLVLTHAPDGTITDWRYEHDPEYTAGAGEVAFDDDVHTHRDLVGRTLDLDADPPALVRDPAFVPVAEVRAQAEQASLNPGTQAVYALLMRAFGDDLLAQEYRERQFGPGPDIADGWREDPTRGQD